MADIAIPPESERIALEDGRPNVTWYRIFANLFRAFNTTQAGLSDATSGLATKAAKTQSVCASWVFARPLAETVPVILNVPFAFTITQDRTKTTLGTSSVVAKVAGVALAGGSLAASVTESSSSRNVAVAAGDDIEILFTGPSADCENLAYTLIGTRELA